MIRASGEIGWFRGSSTPRRLDDGAVLWNGIFADITEVKQTEERLRQAQKMEAVGQLTGGIAHDFNNLLAVISGSIEFLQDEVGERQELKTIDRAVTRGSELTQRLMSFARQQPLRPQTVMLTELIGGLDDLLQRTLGAPIKFLTGLPENLWPVTADPGQLENALLNLALNARDAMPNGGILEIYCSNLEPNQAILRIGPEVKAGNYVEIAVRDTGVGMSDHALEHAFEPFFTTKEVGQGSGLGLSMVYGFARQSGGAAVIDSQLAGGTEARIYLPRAQSSDATNVAEGEGEGEGELRRGNGQLVLVLEDESDVRQLAVAALKGLGYRVLEASDAQQAMKHLDTLGDIDILLSDIVLPGGVSGPEFAAKAKTICPRLRVLFMSGYASGNASQGCSSDFDEMLLMKPFRRAELARAVYETRRGSRKCCQGRCLRCPRAPCRRAPTTFRCGR